MVTDDICSYHINGGEQGNVVGKKAERDGVMRTSENSLQQLSVIIIMHAGSLHNLISYK